MTDTRSDARVAGTSGSASTSRSASASAPGTASPETVSLRPGNLSAVCLLDHFASHIVNCHTRRAYLRAVKSLLIWCGNASAPSVEAIKPADIARWLVFQSSMHAPPTAKLQLSAARHFFDWLISRDILDCNPAATVPDPVRIFPQTARPLLDAPDTQRLISNIDTSTTIGLRDRALIGLMLFSFARIGAALLMQVDDVFRRDRQLWIRLQGKDGQRHEVRCNPTLAVYLETYIDAAGIREDGKTALFRTIQRGTRRLGAATLPQSNAYAMVRRRALAAGIERKVGNETFRAAGIATYLENGGTLENAATTANHPSRRTIRRYGRQRELIMRNDV